MKTCASCNSQFIDGVQCGSCKKHFDFACVSISEPGWRKLGADRRAQWKCPTCKSALPAVSPLKPASLETILEEIRDMKRQLLSLPTLVDDVRVIKEEFSELKMSCEGAMDKLEEFGARITEVETRISDLEKLQDTVNCLQTDFVKAKLDLLSYDQRSRLNNVEIKGVPTKNGENLFSIIETIGRKVNYICPKAQINYISRVPIYNSKEKLIIVSFLNRYIKEDFIAAARSVKELSTSDMGFHGSPQRVYVNDHLSTDQKKLLTKVKSSAKEKTYEYVWVKHGKIHVLKNSNCKVLIIRKESDLNKIV